MKTFKRMQIRKTYISNWKYSVNIMKRAKAQRPEDRMTKGKKSDFSPAMYHMPKPYKTSSL